MDAATVALAVTVAGVVDELVHAAVTSWKNAAPVPRTLPERWRFQVGSALSAAPAVVFNGARLADADVRALASCLEGDAHTAALYLEYSDLADGAAVNALIAAATRARALRVLSLDGNAGLSYATLRPLLSPRAHGAVHELHLAGTALGRDGALDLARWLRVPGCPLAKLNLSGCGIHAVGAIALAEAIEANARLRSVNMSGNRIGNPSAFAFAETVKANRALSCLRLQGVRWRRRASMLQRGSGSADVSPCFSAGGHGAVWRMRDIACR